MTLCGWKVKADVMADYISREVYNRGEMYIGHARLCVCLSLAAFSDYCRDPAVSWGNDY